MLGSALATFFDFKFYQYFSRLYVSLKHFFECIRIIHIIWYNNVAVLKEFSIILNKCFDVCLIADVGVALFRSLAPSRNVIRSIIVACLFVKVANDFSSLLQNVLFPHTRRERIVSRFHYNFMAV